MSDLQCPARLVLARHGESEPGAGDPADDGGGLTGAGREQARGLGRSLLSDRVAHVWTSPLARCVQTAELAAAELGVGVSVRHQLREVPLVPLLGRDGRTLGVWHRWVTGDLDARAPGGETGRELIDSFADVVQEIADGSRGEQMLVVSHAGRLGLCVPALAAGIRPDVALGRGLGPAEVVRCEVDAQGMRYVGGVW